MREAGECVADPLGPSAGPAAVSGIFAAALNTRPRKTLGWRTPAEMLDEYLTAAA